jgi:hypothetical protein
MTAWTKDELTTIETAEELEIASARRDGTLRNPRTIWVVRVGDQIDAAYREKYRRYGPSIIGGVVNPGARAATIRLMPR